MHIIGVLLLLTFVTACGKSDSNAGMPVKEKKVLPLDGSNVQGLYMAKFFTINPGVNGTLPGSATLQRDQNQFMAYVRLFGGAPNAWHQQNVHVGSRCPNAGDDLNGDGYIDIEEGNRVWGKILLPLDANLGSQNKGQNIYPMADASGGYFYEQETSFDDMFYDLKSEDKDLSDDKVKLGPDEGLDFEGKVVVVMGTAKDIIYPDSVASTEGRPAYQTLPIACGVFKRLTRIPGKPYDSGEPQTDAPETPEPQGEVGTPVSTDDEYDTDREPQTRTPWYRRISEWWRETWERERGPRRRQSWSDGNDERGWWIF